MSELLAKLVYEKIKERLPVTLSLSEFEELVSGWKFLPITDCSNELLGVVMQRGNEFHVIASKPGKWASRRLFRETLGAAIKEYGYATTAVMNEHKVGHELAKRLGFVAVKHDDTVTVYRITRLNHVQRETIPVSERD